MRLAPEQLESSLKKDLYETLVKQRTSLKALIDEPTTAKNSITKIAAGRDYPEVCKIIDSLEAEIEEEHRLVSLAKERSRQTQLQIDFIPKLKAQIKALKTVIETTKNARSVGSFVPGDYIGTSRKDLASFEASLRRAQKGLIQLENIKANNAKTDS